MTTRSNRVKFRLIQIWHIHIFKGKTPLDFNCKPHQVSVVIIVAGFM